MEKLCDSCKKNCDDYTKDMFGFDLCCIGYIKFPLPTCNTCKHLYKIIETYETYLISFEGVCLCLNPKSPYYKSTIKNDSQYNCHEEGMFIPLLLGRSFPDTDLE